jgi:hypothetical protein
MSLTRGKNDRHDPETVLLGRRRHRLVRARRRRVTCAGRCRGDAGLAARDGRGPSGRPRDDDDTFVSQPGRSSKPAGLLNDDYDPTPDHHHDGGTTAASVRTADERTDVVIAADPIAYIAPSFDNVDHLPAAVDHDEYCAATLAAALYHDDIDHGASTFATGPSHCDHGATSTPAAAQSADTDGYTSSSVSHPPSAHGHPLNTDGAS